MRARFLPAVVVVLVVAAACGWPMDRFDAGRTGHNTLDRKVGTANVDMLTTEWTGPLATDMDVWSSPIVAGNNVYLGHTDNQLYVFDANGKTNCSGAPTLCEPLWTSPTGGAISSTPALDPVGTIFVGSDDGKLYAFDADGVDNCSGAPLVCDAFWTATTGGPVSSPLFVDGVVYVSADKLYAFDAQGQANCSGTPTVCEPLWTAEVGTEFFPPGRPAFADGVLYVTAGMTLSALDAKGQANCSGTPITCAPLWTATPDCSAISSCVMFPPAVAEGTVYVGSNQSDEFPDGGVLYAFDADGVEGCSGSPITCEPLWEALTRAQFNSPAVARGQVYVTDFIFRESDFSTEGRVLAYDAAGRRGCSGEPVRCTPLWRTGDISRVSGAPSVASGVVYVANALGHVLAFDALGGIGCDGSPVVCTPLWSSEMLVGSIQSSPTPVNGRMFIGERGALHVFAVPE